MLETQAWTLLQSSDPQFLHLESGTSNKPPSGTEQVVWLKERWLTPGLQPQ